MTYLEVVNEAYRFSFVMSLFLNCIGASLRGKKRNSSVQGLCESPSKKPKIDCTKAPKQKGAQIIGKDKSVAVQEQGKTAALSKRASKSGKHKNEITSQSGSSGLQEVRSEAEAAKDKGKQKKASPLKQNHVATPEDIQKSPRKDKVVGKKLKLDLEGEEKTKDELKAGEENSSEESSDDEGVAWEDVDGKRGIQQQTCWIETKYMYLFPCIIVFDC